MIPLSVDLEQFPVQRWARKSQMPDHLKVEGKRVCFRFEIAWVAIDHEGSILMTNGNRMPTYTFCLKTPGWVIGSPDMQAASAKEWAFEWQQASADRKMERIELGRPQ